MMKFAICDDDITFAGGLEQQILSYTQLLPTRVHIEVYQSGQDLLCDLKKPDIRYDLIFLDIEMDGIDGITVGDEIRNAMGDYETDIVYVSYHHHYDEKWSDFKPFSFISKPIDKNRLFTVLKRFIRLYQTKADRFLYTANREMETVRKKDILYFINDQDHVIMKMVDNLDIPFRSTMENVMKSFESDYFIRISKKYFVNMDKIISKSPSGIQMENESWLRVTRKNREKVMNIITKFLEGKYLAD